MYTDNNLINFEEEDVSSSGVDSEYSTCITSSGSYMDKRSSPLSPKSNYGGFSNMKNPLVNNQMEINHGEERYESFHSEERSCQFPLTNIDNDASEWCQNDYLGIRVSKKDNLIFLTFNSKTYACDFSNHSIEYVKPVNKCSFSKEEKCYIRHCYDRIRMDYGLSLKKDIAFVIYTAIYNFQDFYSQGDILSLAVQDIHSQFVQDEVLVDFNKDYRNILQLVYNLSRFDNFKEDFDYVEKWMKEHLNYNNNRRAFDIVYCAYYTNGYEYGCLSSVCDQIYHQLVDEIRHHVKEIKKVPSPKSVQHGIGILKFDSCGCLFDKMNDMKNIYKQTIKTLCLLSSNV